MMTAYGPEDVLQAYQRLIQLNLESWKPEVTAWLHSEETAPELAQFLVLVPCSATVH
jgi:hypothetical protein